MGRDMHFTVYILRTSANTLYIGQTNDLEKRIREHKSKSKRSSKYMRSFDSFTLVYTETYATKSEALKREWVLKQLPRIKKESLIKSAKIACTL
jgi:putative endonuclease